MLARGTFILFLFLFSGSLLYGQLRLVVRKHQDGSPYVVVYVVQKGKVSERVKQEVFYPNGKLDYVGHYKNGTEHGIWTYYYEDGTKMAEETWEDGKEDGIHYEYRSDGTLQREQHYRRGKLIKDIMH